MRVRVDLDCSGPLVWAVLLVVLDKCAVLVLGDPRASARVKDTATPGYLDVGPGYVAIVPGFASWVCASPLMALFLCGAP